MSEGAITFAYDGSQEKWMRDSIRKMRELGFNSVWSGPYSLERICFGNIDADLADKVYREAKIPYAIHAPLIKHQVELNRARSGSHPMSTHAARKTSATSTRSSPVSQRRECRQC